VKVFVYGTLKRGHGNNHVLGDSTFLGTGETVARCRLFNSGFPVLRPGDKNHAELNRPVRGELFEVSEETLDRLDRLEGEGRMYFRFTKFIRLDDGKVVKAYAYVGGSSYWRGRGRLRLYDIQNDRYVWQPPYRAAS